MRVPSWTDRILWVENSKYVKSISYEMKNNRFSDHRPVIGFFDVYAHKHEHEKKQSYIKEIKGQAKVKQTPVEPEESKVFG